MEEEEEDQTVPDPVSIDGLQGNVEFDHVHFGYNADKIIVNDFSAKIKEGQKIAMMWTDRSRKDDDDQTADAFL